MDLTTHQLITLLFAVIVVVGVALGRYPVLRMNRATIALVGATGMVLIGAMTLD